MTETPTSEPTGYKFAEQKSTFKLAIACCLLAMASWLWLEIDPFEGRADAVLRSAVVLGMVMCSVACLYFGALTLKRVNRSTNR
jgi:hypothetical protein